MLLDKVLFNKTKVPILNAALDVSQLRQRVIANNMANVATKGYRRKSVRFDEYLESYVKQTGPQGETTDPHHLQIPQPTSFPEVYEPPSGENDSGINNVDVDQEMADLAENHLFFNISARLLGGQFDGLKKSISGRVG